MPETSCNNDKLRSRIGFLQHQSTHFTKLQTCTVDSQLRDFFGHRSHFVSWASSLPGPYTLTLATLPPLSMRPVSGYEIPDREASSGQTEFKRSV